MISKGKWKNQQARRNYFDGLFKVLGYKQMDDWYKVTKQDIVKYGGGGLISSYYNASPSAALQDVYPEHNWMLWKFTTMPRDYWDKTENQKEFFDRLSVKLGHKGMDDW